MNEIKYKKKSRITMAPQHTENNSFIDIIKILFDNYKKETSNKEKLVDCFLVFYFLCGVIIFLYCILVTPYPFNSFLSAMFSCVGCFILSGMTFSLYLSLSIYLSMISLFTFS